MLIKNMLLKKNSDWSLTSPTTFYPITGLKIRDGAVWVRTFRSDFFLVDLNVSARGVILQQLKFLRMAPNGTSQENIQLLKIHKSDDFIYTIIGNEDCDFSTGLNIEISRLDMSEIKIITLINNHEDRGQVSDLTLY